MVLAESGNCAVVTSNQDLARLGSKEFARSVEVEQKAVHSL